MSEVKEQYPIGKVNYQRYKKSSSDKIVFHDNQYMVKRKTTVKGYDVLLRKWDILKQTEEFLPLSAWKYPPQKVVEAEIIVYRTATDYRTLKTLQAYFKKTMKVTVKDLESNIYLVYVDKRVFMTDVSGRVNAFTTPLQMNANYRNIKVEFLGEDQRISVEEKDKLVSEGTPLFEERQLPNGESQYILLV